MDLEITVDYLGPDWVVIRPAISDFRKLVEIDVLPDRIEKSLIIWFRAHPGYKVRSTLGIVEDGSTVAVHVWFDTRD